MGNNIINKLQLCSILILIMMSPFLGTGFYLLIKSSGIDAYFSIIIGGICGLLPILVYIYVNNYQPELPLNKKINLLFGKEIGYLLNIIICICMLGIGTFGMYNLINFIVSQFLSETPFLIIGIMFSIVIIYVNIKGIETLSRTSVILVIINLLIFFTAVLGIASKFDINNIKPILEFGIQRTFKGAFILITMNVSSLLMLLMIPKNTIIANKKTGLWIIITYIVTILFMGISIFLTLGNLGIHLASVYQYPEYLVLKRISLFKFLDRIENIVIIQWIFGIYINLSLIVYYISNTIKYNNKSKLLPSVITCVLLILSILVFKNNTQFNEYSYKYLPYVRLVLLIILLLIGITILFKKLVRKKN